MICDTIHQIASNGSSELFLDDPNFKIRFPGITGYRFESDYPHLQASNLAEAEDLHARYLPDDAEIFLIPELHKSGAKIGGTAYTQRPIILLTSEYYTHRLRCTAHHEIYHFYEFHGLIQEREIRIIESAAQGGRSYDDGYLDAPMERRARLYAAWASAMDEGYQVRTLNGAMAPLDDIFYEIHSGARLQAWKAAQEAAARRAPESLFSRLRSFLGPPRPLPAMW